MFKYIYECMLIAFADLGRVKCLWWSGWGSFFSLEGGTVRAVRALNRQRIMEIKVERLANGNIMATGCLGQLGHANEASDRGRINMYEQSSGWR